MKNKRAGKSNNYRMKQISKLVFLLIFCLCFLLSPVRVWGNHLSEKQAQLNNLEKQINEYQVLIKQKQQEAASLQNQIAIIDASLEKTRLEIQETENRIEKTELEIEDTQNKITQKQREMEEKKKILKEGIRAMYEQEKLSIAEILISSSSFSEFVDQMEYLSIVENRVKALYDELVSIKNELIKQRNILEGQKAELVKLKGEKEIEERSLEGQIATKQALLEQTKGEEKAYQEKLSAAQAEQAAMNAEIVAIQAELLRNFVPARGGSVSPAGFIWPLYGPITAPFGYSPYYFPGVFHTGIDIAAPTGTPVVSATNGTVFKAGWGGGYGNCVMIVTGNLLIVYGHFSGLACSAGQNVSQGQVIGYVGSTGWSTGPHLHFEIRENFTTPVNPLNYLP